MGRVKFKYFWEFSLLLLLLLFNVNQVMLSIRSAGA